MNVNNKEISVGDWVLCKPSPESVAVGVPEGEFKARAVGVYGYAIVVQKEGGGIYDLTWDEVDKIN
jgi:hypothetical protein